jgi:hypothetical protein
MGAIFVELPPGQAAFGRAMALDSAWSSLPGDGCATVNWL